MWTHDYELTEIKEAAALILNRFQSKKIWAFYAQMGSGKTTFISAVCSVLQVKSYVSSPTFSIINEYEIPAAGTIYHIDLYRLNTAEEAISAGVEECLLSNQYCFVEWPERAVSLLPPETLHIEISRLSDSRRQLIIK